jgi:hypothetical protein
VIIQKPEGFSQAKWRKASIYRKVAKALEWVTEQGNQIFRRRMFR